MGETKVRKKRSKGHTVEYRRGITMAILTWDGTAYKDRTGREYTEGRIFGHRVYHLKGAMLCTGQKSYLGICDKVKTHRSHCDHLPRSKKCSCGGTFIFDEITPEIVQVKSSTRKGAPGA